MVDAADHEKFDASKNELHNLLDKPQLSGIPVRMFEKRIFYFVPNHYIVYYGLIVNIF